MPFFTCYIEIFRYIYIRIDMLGVGMKEFIHMYKEIKN